MGGKMNLRLILLFLVLLIHSIFTNNTANAHYIQSHLAITALAREIFAQDSYSNLYNEEIINFLNKEAPTGRTYIEYLLDGVRDADLRANGVYNLDKSCRSYWSDLETSSSQYVYYYLDQTYEYVYVYHKPDGTCPDAPDSVDDGIQTMDIPHWPIGDHAYNPKTCSDLEPEKCLGFHSQIADSILQKLGITQSVDGQYSPPSDMEEYVRTYDLLYLQCDKDKGIDCFPGTDEAQRIIKLKEVLDNANAYLMAEHFYEFALKEWRDGNFINAIFNLGIVLHSVQDMSVPTHVHVGENVVYTDADFENFIWNDYLLQGADPSTEGDYSQKSIGNWIRDTALETYDTSNISITDQPSANMAEKSVNIALKSTIGVIFSFFHDVNVGIYDASGFHTDGTSQAFVATYNENKSIIGYPADNGGGVFVHEYRGVIDDSFSVWIQDFYNPATDQWYALILNDLEDEPVVYLLQGAIRNFYMNDDGPYEYGVPFTSEIAGKLADSHLTVDSDLIKPSSESFSGCEPQSIVVQKFKRRKNGTYYNNERKTIVHNPDNGVTGHMGVGEFEVSPDTLLNDKYPSIGDVVTFADPLNPDGRYAWPVEPVESCHEWENIVPTSYDKQGNLGRWFTKAGSYLIFVNDINGNPVISGLIHEILEGNLQFIGNTIKMGDIDGSGFVDLADLIKSLQLIAGIPIDGMLKKEADVNYDGKIGLAEVIFDLKTISGMISTTTQFLNDTGITGGGNFPSDNNSVCASNIVGAQDCNLGRDATHNDNSDGHAGFSFTKLDSSGAPLADQNIDYNTVPWACVKDNVTGLIWEVKTNDNGLHDKDDSYNWYNTDPATNGGSDGYDDDDGNTCYGYDNMDPTTFCNTKSYVSRVNEVGWCGYSDWRVPTLKELQGIISYNRYMPAIDTNFFANTPSENIWSSTPQIFTSLYGYVQGINLRYGGNSIMNSDDSAKVWLVRGGH